MIASPLTEIVKKAMGFKGEKNKKMLFTC